MNDNTVLFSSLLLDACIVPVSVPVCHLDSRQLQQPPPSLMNNQQHQLQHQNNPPHLAYQQANHHSYTTVTTSNQHGPSHLPPGGGVMGVHQQGPVLPHLQHQVSPLLFREFLCALTLSLFLSLSCAFCQTCMLFYSYFLCACPSDTLPRSTIVHDRQVIFCPARDHKSSIFLPKRNGERKRIWNFLLLRMLMLRDSRMNQYFLIYVCIVCLGVINWQNILSSSLFDLLFANR